MERYPISRSSRQRVLERAERLLHQRQQQHHQQHTQADIVATGNQSGDTNKPLAVKNGQNADGNIRLTSTTNTQTNERDFHKRTWSIGTQIPVVKSTIGAPSGRRNSSSDSGLGSGWSKMCDESWILPKGHKLTPTSDQFLAPPGECSTNENSSQTIALSSSMESPNLHDKVDTSGNNSEQGPGTEQTLEEATGQLDKDQGSVSDHADVEQMESDSDNDDSLLMSDIDSLAGKSLQQAKLEKIRESVEARRRLSNTNTLQQASTYRMLPKRQEKPPRSHIPVMYRNVKPKQQEFPAFEEMAHPSEGQGFSHDDMAQLTYKLNHVEHAATLKGKLVTFFKNGDSHFKGLKVSISARQWPRMDTLLDYLDQKIYTPKGIRHLFVLPSGEEITKLDQFINGRSYVVSSTKHIARVSYGDSKEKYWNNKPPTAGKYRKSDTSLAVQDVKVRKAHSYPASSRASSLSNSVIHYGPPQPIRKQQEVAHNDYTAPGLYSVTEAKPKVLTIISNTHRDSQEKVILNPRTNQLYEEILQDVTGMLRMEYPPVQALWTARKPNKKVSSFSHLLRLLKQYDTYLATGQEGQPFELNPRGTNGLQHTDEPPAVKRPIKAKQRKPYKSLPQKYKVDTNEEIEDFVSNGVPEPEFENHATSPAHTNPLHRQNGHYQYALHNPRQPAHKQKPAQLSNSTRYRASTPDGLENLDTVPAYPYSKHKARQYPPKPRNQLPQSKLAPDPRLVSATPPPHSRESDVPTKILAKQVPYRRPYEERDCVKVDIHGFSRSFYAPRYGQHEPDGGKPHKKLKLDWVYGYRGRDARNNLLVLPSGELLYFVATVVILYDAVNDQQRHYREHTEDVTCIALHPEVSRPRVASGQAAGYNTEDVAHIRVWDPTSLVTYSIVGAGFFTNSVTSIGFSTMTSGLELGSLLMAVDESDKHVLSVWDWQHDHMLAKTHTSEDTVVWGQFHPLDHTTLITYGKNHVFFWKLFWDPHTDSVGKLYRDKKSGLYEGDYMPKFVTSLAFSSSGDVITGDSNGRVVVWQTDHTEAFVYNQTLSEPMTSAHQKSVFTLHMLDDGTLISGGGNCLRFWDSLNGYRSVREKELPAEFGSVRSLVPVKSGTVESGLFVGTTQNCLLSGTVHETFRPIVQGPYNELWALATHPDDYTFVSAGMDQKVRKWDALNHTVVWDMAVEKPCLSLDLDPTGSVIALGTTSGRFIALSGLDGMHIFSMQAGNVQIGVVKFSPEGDYIALGSHDSSIYVYEVEDEGHVFRRHGTGILRGHKNFLTHIDWSTNGKYLRSVSGDYDLLFWSVDEMREVVAQSVRDEVWFSETAVLSYNHLGAWSNLLEGEDINTTDLAHKKDVLAVGENMGSLKLYKFPCTSERPHFCDQKPYSGHVTKVAFSFDDHFLLSSGGKDAGILQWTVVKNTHR